MSRPKYTLCPGYVTSVRDGDRHWINARQLAALYGVRLDECEVRPEAIPSRGRAYAPNRWEPKADLELHPQTDGNYTLSRAIRRQP